VNQSDKNFKTRYGSFLLLVRQDAPGVLRGQIKHVQSDDESPFATLNDILRFIEAHIQPPNQEWK